MGTWQELTNSEIKTFLTDVVSSVSFNVLEVLSCDTCSGKVEVGWTDRDGAWGGEWHSRWHLPQKPRQARPPVQSELVVPGTQRPSEEGASPACLGLGGYLGVRPVFIIGPGVGSGGQPVRSDPTLQSLHLGQGRGLPGGGGPECSDTEPAICSPELRRLLTLVCHQVILLSMGLASPAQLGPGHVGPVSRQSSFRATV